MLSGHRRGFPQRYGRGGVGIGRVQRHFREFALVAVAADELAPSRREKPAFDPIQIADLVKVRLQLEEGVLGEVLRVGLVEDQAAGIAVGGRVVGFDDGLVSRGGFRRAWRRSWYSCRGGCDHRWSSVEG